MKAKPRTEDLIPKPSQKPKEPKKPRDRDTAKEEESETSPAKEFAIELLKKDIPIALLILGIIIGSLFAYTQNWPPMVVVESSSMMHGDDSSVGVIDTGDLVLVKKVSSRSEIKSWAEGRTKDYETYGTYGNVIIYNKNGAGGTPVIHRAVVWVEFNDTTFNYNETRNDWTGGSYDIPELDAYGITGVFQIAYYGHERMNLTINFRDILDNFAIHVNRPSGERLGLRKMPHSGYLTKGDKNFQIDQLSLSEDGPNTILVEPVEVDWIIGKAEGELPWFGLIKLYFSGQIDEDRNPAPESSKNSLIIALVLIIAIPLCLDITIGFLEKKRAKKDEEEEAAREQEHRVGPGVSKKAAIKKLLRQGDDNKRNFFKK